MNLLQKGNEHKAYGIGEIRQSNKANNSLKEQVRINSPETGKVRGKQSKAPRLENN